MNKNNRSCMQSNAFFSIDAIKIKIFILVEKGPSFRYISTLPNAIEERT